MTTARQSEYAIGPRFFLADDGRHIQFSYRVDSACEIGPREATDADKARYPEAWKAFKATKAARKPEGKRPSA